jgi:hypothetical protein
MFQRSPSGILLGKPRHGKLPTRFAGSLASKALRRQVWLKHIGYKMTGRCFACAKRQISFWNFEIGQYKVTSKGRSGEISNLRPICRHCNSAIGKTSIEAFKRQSFSFKSKKKAQRKTHTGRRTRSARTSDR